MDYSDISPKYLMELIPKVEETLWGMFDKARYQNVRRYIEKWHEDNYQGGYRNDDDENFHTYFKNAEQNEIDLSETLHKMPNITLIRVAIDLGIDTPAFLPVTATFKNILRDESQSAYQNFERAMKNVHDNPDQAVSLASSALEGIIKTILSDDAFSAKDSVISYKSLTKLVSAIVKAFGFNDKTVCPPELVTIASQLRGIGSTIDDLRSDKSTAHGKAHDEYVIDDPLWASFIVNTSASLGLFLWEYYEKKYRPAKAEIAKGKSKDAVSTDDSPIDLSQIPF